MAEEAGSTTAPPYPLSPVIRALRWEATMLRSGRRTGDNWPTAWIDDDLQITSYGDGGGFSGREPELSLGFARVFGDPTDLRFEDFESNADVKVGYGHHGIKSSGMLSVEHTLYLWVRNYIPDPESGDYTHARLAWSEDLGKTWTWADWHFAKTFGCPAFVQFGRDYAGARDDYVYVVSQGNDDAYAYDPDIVLARVPKAEVPDRSAYAFYAGRESDGEPRWSADIADRVPIFTDPNGTQRVSMTYNAPLGRYLLVTSHDPPGCEMETHTAALGIFDAPEPWGPWSTVYYHARWSDGFRTYHHRIPPKWIAKDGRSLWLLYSGLADEVYDFCLKRAHLELNDPS